ncbi:MAG: hypothetical protein LBQ47_03795 [Endomicrobium sp.]|jgi:hypothetical protein|nr:hypothetical protein [Endomicrobium sp.]
MKINCTTITIELQNDYPSLPFNEVEVVAYSYNGNFTPEFADLVCQTVNGDMYRCLINKNDSGKCCKFFKVLPNNYNNERLPNV